MGGSIMEKKLGPAEKRLIAVKKEHNALRKSKQKDNATKKQIKRLEGMFPDLKRKAYKEKTIKFGNIIQNDDIERLEKLRLQELNEEYLKRRKEQNKLIMSNENDVSDSKPICNSCGAPLRDVYGIIRCKCN
jgi:hypothetical protein